MGFAWVILVLRSGLAIAAGVGLLQRSEWGRILAIISAFLSLIHFPFGTALGIWTLVVLLGYKNTSLYAQNFRPGLSGLSLWMPHPRRVFVFAARVGSDTASPSSHHLQSFP